jgi:hypothetical protein
VHATVFALALSVLPAGHVTIAPSTIEPTGGRVAAAVATAPPDDEAPRDTINEFLPEERGLGECISALPKPGCGSEARGGWRQGVVLLSILTGLGFIAWRVVRSARRARLGEQQTTTAAAPQGDKR